MVAMTEILALVLLAAAFFWGVTRTNLFRHWRRQWLRHGADPGGITNAASDGKRWDGEGVPPGSFHVQGGARRSQNHRL
jgi:hypothetical protein